MLTNWFHLQSPLVFHRQTLKVKRYWPESQSSRFAQTEVHRLGRLYSLQQTWANIAIPWKTWIERWNLQNKENYRLVSYYENSRSALSRKTHFEIQEPHQIGSITLQGTFLKETAFQRDHVVLKLFNFIISKQYKHREVVLIAIISQNVFVNIHGVTLV